MKIPLYTQDGEKKGELAASDKVFNRKVNKGLIHKILVLQRTNRRRPVAHALTKGEVRGGGKKPYRQKHTGNARQGSTTNPHFIGGGVAFGPRNTRNWTVGANKKERRLALFGALTEKLKDSRVSALENYSAPEPKTKTFTAMLKKLPFKKSILIVLPAKNELIERSSRNIPRVKTILVNYLNILDLLKYRDVLFLKNSLPKIEEIFHG